MNLPIRLPREAGVPRRALDILLGFALGAALAFALVRALAARRSRQFEEPVEDPLLLERVRAALGWTIADPDAVDLRVSGGTVILRGPATAEQIAEMVACASRVRGVRAVDNRLSPAG
jgi:osmotically-inducible protein OsmY